MTGAEFERAFTQWLDNNGFWALNIPRNQFGAQPFDIIAIKGSVIWAVDCKVCHGPRFEFRRIEDNQYLAFDKIRKRVNNARCGIVCYHAGGMYFIPIQDIYNKNSLSIGLKDKESYFIGVLRENE